MKAAFEIFDVCTLGIDLGKLALVEEELEAVEGLQAVFKPFGSGWWQSP